MTAERQADSAVFVDTGAYAALVIAVDSNQRRAHDTLTALERRRTIHFTTNFVVAETYALILARAGRSVRRD